MFGVLFEAFAHDVGLDYVISTYISCGAITLDEYGTCIRAEEGSNSWTFQALRSAARTYGYAFSRAPSLGDGTYCNDIFTCGVGEGDCDRDADCDDGLYCADNTGGNYGFASWVDTCEAPVRVPMPWVPRR